MSTTLPARVFRLFLLAALIVSSFGSLLVGGPTDAARASAGSIITLEPGGFVPSELTVDLGTSVTWRNNTATPLHLSSAAGVAAASRLFLPLVITAGGSTATPAAQPAGAATPASVAFDTIIAPGAEWSYQFTAPGQFAFVDAGQVGVGGTVNVVPGQQVADCADEPPAPAGEADQAMPGLLYATAADRTLLRWYWDDCTSASFAVYRSVDGGPEALLATVEPVIDPAAATALLDSTDPRWPNLSSYFDGKLLTAADLSGEQSQLSVTELYHYLYTNGLAGVYLTNQYYPLALMLGWGYLDTDVVPGVAYTYRVEALGASPRELGSVSVEAGQPTPLPTPGGLAGDVLTEVADQAGDWGTAQRNRRFHGQIYLDWDTADGLDLSDPAAPGLTIGYDVFRATALADDGSILAAEPVRAADADGTDSMVVPGPDSADDGADYLFRYTPGDFTAHTFCVAPRDLLNQQISWPADAARCSDPVTVAARDFAPPAPPTDVGARAQSNSDLVTISWAHPDSADVNRFIVQRTKDMHCAGGDCWADVATLAGNRTSWKDVASPCANDPLDAQGCWYRLIASDAAGNRSAPSRAVFAHNYDTLPPAAPVVENIECVNPADPDNHHCVDISDPPGGEPAVSVRVVCRLSAGGPELFIAEVDAADFFGLDLVALIKGVYQPPLHLQGVACRFIAADLYGNLSELDDSPVKVIDVDSDNPDQLARPVISAITPLLEAPEDWAARVDWQMAAHPMLDSFVIERTRASDGVVANIALLGQAARSFVDTDVELGERYTYMVRAIPGDGDINQTESEPRGQRILPGEERPLAVLPWYSDPQHHAQESRTSLVVQLTPLGPDRPVAYAVFRSLHADRDFLPITPILQTTETVIIYSDEQAQRQCYFYQVVSFDYRTGEPNGYAEPRQPAGCAAPAPTIYQPGPDLPAPTPALFCVPAAQGLLPEHNFRFGGGFEVVLEGLSDAHNGASRVDGGGWLLLETAGETIYAPMSFSHLTVDGTGRVCSGTASVDLSTLPGGGLDLQAPGGWHYRLRGITLQPWATSTNVALATLDLYGGDAFTNHDSSGAAAERIELVDAELLASLRFSYELDTATIGGHSCASPALAFRLETLPLDVIPTGMVQVDELSIDVGAACTSYVDRYTPASDPQIVPPQLSATPERAMNDGFLAAQLAGSAVALTPAGLDGDFSTGAPVAWYGAYPFATRVALSGGLSLSIADGQISAGSTSAGTIEASYHTTVDGDARALIGSPFNSLAIGPRGDLTGAVTLGAISWDAFSTPAAPANGWSFYQGALTTLEQPAFHDEAGQGRTIMWRPSPSGVAPVALPDDSLPGLIEPGFNRRQAGSALSWDNCGAGATFNNVAVDAYLRHGGITQRHIPIYDVASQMEVHGYTFIPERFDLHFRDNALLDHEISGRIDLPFPSDIEVLLENVWLAADADDPAAGEAACIGGGEIPAGEQDHSLAFWHVDTHLTRAEFRPGPDAAMRLWFVGEIRNLPHLRVSDGGVALPAELAFTPDGNFLDVPENGPRYDRPDYVFQGFPYLIERLRLSDWYDQGDAEQPAWEPSATTIDLLPAATWDNFGFVGLRGVPLAPYFGPLVIAAGPAGDNMVMAAWNPEITGFAGQPRVSKEWVKLERVRISFDYDHLVHAYDPASGRGLFVGFRDYRFVPDDYAHLGPISLEQLQVLQLDTGVVIEPDTTAVQLGLSSGVATLRALAQARGFDPDDATLALWAARMAVNGTAAPVYVAQYRAALTQHGPFTPAQTTSVLDAMSDANVASLIDQDNVGGRTQGLLEQKGVSFRRVRGVIEVEGSGLEVQFARFQLSTQVEIKGREKSQAELLGLAPLPENPALEPDPPLFYAERMTLSIVRHGDITLVGKNVQSSKFADELESFDATLVINATKPQFEGGLTLFGLKAGSVTLDNASAVLGVGAEVNYLGVSFDGTIEVGLDSIDVGGELLAGVVDPNSAVLENNFADAMDQIAGDLVGEVDVDELANMSGFYMRAYGADIPIIGKGCVLSLKGDAELAFWYWKLDTTSTQVGGLLKPAVYGQVLCLVQARGALSLEYNYVDGQESFDGEGYVAGGIGACDPKSWGDWDDRWWGDGACAQAGAGIVASYTSGADWEVEASADYERLFGD